MLLLNENLECPCEQPLLNRNLAREKKKLLLMEQETFQNYLSNCPNLNWALKLLFMQGICAEYDCALYSNINL
jgi:hypothetical protein